MKVLIRERMKGGKFSLIGICILATMMGCSSRLHTTVMSETQEPRKMAKAELPPSPVEAAETLPPNIQPSKGIPPIDIPVEEPARPTLRHSESVDIFATPRTGIIEPQALASPVAPVPTEPEPSLSLGNRKSAAPGVAPETFQAMGIPPIEIEPEMPALPTIREPINKEVVPPQELVAKSEPEQVQEVAPAPIPDEPKDESLNMASPPVEVAKVIPPSPEIIETTLQPLKDVFFDYDRFAIRPDAARVLKDTVSSLVASLSDKNLIIEGHCDERGTSSYNMVLGKRRANAVKEFLVYLGVQEDKLKVVSYGKERPFCTEQTQECWQENRRGHFVLK
ncbi:MAG: OmpA family protein [Nitrospirales bacterium]|nr:OmpA family protein [Nitrospirales bacterium]